MSRAEKSVWVVSLEAGPRSRVVGAEEEGGMRRRGEMWRVRLGGER